MCNTTKILKLSFRLKFEFLIVWALEYSSPLPFLLNRFLQGLCKHQDYTNVGRYWAKHAVTHGPRTGTISPRKEVVDRLLSPPTQIRTTDRSTP